MSSFSGFYEPHQAKEVHVGYLPHWQQEDKWYFLTWRLADSIPREKLKSHLAQQALWLSQHPKPWDAKTERMFYERFPQQIEKWIDQGGGECWLADAVHAQIIASALDYFDHVRYRIACYVIMPNHVHLLLRIINKHTLEDVNHSIKRYTATKINQRLGRTGQFWHHESWDRLVRSEKHFFKIVSYIENNPVKARLKKGQYLLKCYKRGNNEAFE